jgi:acetylornithine deacetylase/succinyl-diaminopimelate desuccinylase-like protein
LPALDNLFRYIDEKFNGYIPEYQRLVQQPSISAQHKGIDKCAEMVKDYAIKAGIKNAQIVPIEGGHPVVYGEIKSKSSKKTLILYAHYDVQPPEPFEEWKSDPFSAEIRDGRLWGRGASDDKSGTFAAIKAAEAYLNATGDVPVNLKFVFEGEEEIGSPNLPKFIQAYKEKLSADGAFILDGSLDISGRPVIDLGVKGIVYIELRAKGASKDVHSSRAPIIPSPVWRLVWALNTLKDKNEKIKIEGFYEKVRKPTKEEVNLLKKLPFDEKKILAEYGLKNFLRGLSGSQLKKTYFFEPTCNICGIEGGYTGLGAKTVLPHEAFAKIDFRLVPDMEAEEVLSKTKKHLNKMGFGDIDVVSISGYPPARISVNEQISKASIEAARKVYGVAPIVYPTVTGSAPNYVFVRNLNTPAIGTGCGDPNSNAHAPNESITVDLIKTGIKYAVALIYAFSK